jgi:hypothetical protein
MPKPREHPLLFSGPMVRPLLREIENSGTGKTETRRLIKPQPRERKEGKPGWWEWGHFMGAPKATSPRSIVWNEAVCRESGGGAPLDQYVRWQPGDRFWVRETWAYYGGNEYIYQRSPRAVVYGADEGLYHPAIDGPHWADAWRSSVHMPRWAARLGGEILSVRIDRLQDITEKGAIAEGVRHVTQDDLPRQAARSERQDFSRIWDSINGKRGPWESNPWVAVLSLRPEVLHG